MRLTDYVKLWEVSANRARSERHYRDFQAFQARLLVAYLEQQGVALAGRLLLDLGSGIGGYSQEFARCGARVFSLDLMQPRLEPGLTLSQIRGNARHIPLASEVLDLVFCASLIEHVPEPDALLAEIERVLRKGGIAYVSFPPYFSPLGGHEFAPFHYLGERAALRLARRRPVAPWVRDLYGGPEHVTAFSDLFDGWGLYQMTIRKFRQLVNNTSLQCSNVATRYMPISFVRWLMLYDLLTWHAQFLLAKPDQGLVRTL